ncbi:hypothetical protein QC761_606900 [Podospora bellae-mahoneyi]|uniref:Clr5 domain-containing protein n=1 Tax=Podospora bellae-mahoneyi TaxID=2093777 RepID=A0ABR0FBQ9_9PEZI|nr:hypothetical protein QC761_606900 [Podospora bellae-mahoneyi]
MVASDGAGPGPSTVAVEREPAPPASGITGLTGGEGEEGGRGGGGGSSTGTKKWATEEDFNKHREIITQLYHRETLSQLMQTMEVRYGFLATNKMYRARFKRWGLGKRKRSDSALANRPRKPKLKQPVPMPMPMRPAAGDASQHAQPEPEPELQEDDVEEIIPSHHHEQHAVPYVQRRRGLLLVNGKWIDLSLMTDDERRYLLRQHKSRKQTVSSPPSTSTALSLSRSPSPRNLQAPDTLQSTENMYRAVRDYFMASFTSNRWSFLEDTTSADQARNDKAVMATHTGVRRGFEIWRRLMTAVRLFHDTSHPDNRAQSIKVIRITFAELTSTLSSGRESPLLFFWVMHALTLFRSIPDPNFQRLEIYLLKHLFELTETVRLQNGAIPHPTAQLWKVLYSNGQSLLFSPPSSPSPDNDDKSPLINHTHLSSLISLAVSLFSSHYSPLHKRTIELSNLAIFTSLPPHHPSSSTLLTPKFHSLFTRVTSSLPDVFDGREMDVRAWLASHYFTLGDLTSASSLLEPILLDPIKLKEVNKVQEASESFNLLYGSIKMAMGDVRAAEGILRQVIKRGRISWKEHGEDVHLSDGLLALDQCLRVQGRTKEADEVIKEHRQLLREALMRRGEEDT